MQLTNVQWPPNYQEDDINAFQAQETDSTTDMGQYMGTDNQGYSLIIIPGFISIAFMFLLVTSATLP